MRSPCWVYVSRLECGRLPQRPRGPLPCGYPAGPPRAVFLSIFPCCSLSFHWRLCICPHSHPHFHVHARFVLLQLFDEIGPVGGARRSRTPFNGQCCFRGRSGRRCGLSRPFCRQQLTRVPGGYNINYFTSSRCHVLLGKGAPLAVEKLPCTLLVAKQKPYSTHFAVYQEYGEVPPLVDVAVNSGPWADLLRRNPGAFETCVGWDTNPMVCRPLLSEAPHTLPNFRPSAVEDGLHTLVALLRPIRGQASDTAEARSLSSIRAAAARSANGVTESGQGPYSALGVPSTNVSFSTLHAWSPAPARARDAKLDCNNDSNVTRSCWTVCVLSDHHKSLHAVFLLPPGGGGGHAVFFIIIINAMVLVHRLELTGSFRNAVLYGATLQEFRGGGWRLQIQSAASSRKWGHLHRQKGAMSRGLNGWEPCGRGKNLGCIWR